MQIGLIGLENAGKRTLFKTVTKTEQISDSARGVVPVPDSRLDKLTELFRPKRQVNAMLEVVTVPGLQVSEEGKVKITSAFLNAVKNNDLLLHIVRAFENDTVAHPEGSVDALRDINFLDTEFLLADLLMVENRIEKLRKDVLKNKSDRLAKELPLFEKMSVHLNDQKPLRTFPLDESEMLLLAGYQFLTLKPLLIGINFNETEQASVEQFIASIEEKIPEHKGRIIPFFAQFEFELSQLSGEDAAVFMEDMGITESALSRLLRLSYHELGLISFLTCGEDETRAWTIRKSSTAQTAAGTIHTDFFAKFIRAEVVHFDDYVKHGSYPKCKEAGVWRLEGKEYIVKDGDILVIRHS